MAKRYSGTVTISIRYVDNESAYRCYLTSPLTFRRQGYAVSIREPASLNVPVDSSEAYDAVAHAALSFLANDIEEWRGNHLNSHAEILACAESSDSGWCVARSAVRACCDRDDRRQSKVGV
jgi:hypothetical protein